MTRRKEDIRKFLKQKGYYLASLASPFILGMDADYIEINDEKLKQEVMKGYDYETGFEKINKYSYSRYAIDLTENPHPRFPGLMQSIRERRGEKIKILIPLYKDEFTNFTEPTPREPYPG